MILKKKRAPERYEERVVAHDSFLLEFKQGRKKYHDKGYGCDLSIKGVRFSTLAKLEPSKPVEMTLYFAPEYPGKKEVKVQAKLVRGAKKKQRYFHETACEFLPAQDDDLQEIRDFLKWVAKFKKGDSSHKISSRRSVERVQADDHFVLEFTTKKGGVPERGFGSNLSTSGAKFATTAKVKEGQRLQLVLLLSPAFSEKSSVTLEAEVVYVLNRAVKNYRVVGCRFLEKLPAKTYKILSSFIEWAETQ